VLVTLISQWCFYLNRCSQFLDRASIWTAASFLTEQEIARLLYMFASFDSSQPGVSTTTSKVMPLIEHEIAQL
jgi:hypothetical protein